MPLEPKIVIESETRAYMQKQKPEPLGQQDIETLALRLNVSPSSVTHFVLDDIMLDGDGQKHPARRLTVDSRPMVAPLEGATDLDDVPAPTPVKEKPKRGRPKKAKA